MKQIIEQFKKWKDGKDDVWVSDEIHEFMASLSRGEIDIIMSFIENQFEETIKLPNLELKVKATAVGDCIADVIGYYHYDKSDGKHYVCSENGLRRYEVHRDSIRKSVKHDR